MNQDKQKIQSLAHYWHRRLWLALAESGSSDKNAAVDALSSEAPAGIFGNSSCSACAASGGYCNGGMYCPLTWQGNSCTAYGSQFNQWLWAGNREGRKIAAFTIAHLPWDATKEKDRKPAPDTQEDL